MLIVAVTGLQVLVGLVPGHLGHEQKPLAKQSKVFLPQKQVNFWEEWIFVGWWKKNWDPGQLVPITFAERL